MKDNRNYLGYGAKDFSFEWPNKSKLALQFVLNYEEGAENSIPVSYTHLTLPTIYSV